MGTNNIIKDFNDPKNWKRTHKKGYEVYVCRPRLETFVHNRLEKANYKTDKNKQFVVSGTVGEQWVIDIKKLVSTYCFVDGRPITVEELKKRMDSDGQIDWMHLKTITGAEANLNWAFHLPISIKNFPVQTSWGDTLYANAPDREHGQGDFLVCSDANGTPNFNDVWVVNGLVFSYTYDMRAFPNMTVKTNNVTPVPGTLLKKRDVNGNTVQPLLNTKAVSVDYTKPVVTARIMNGRNLLGYVLKMPDGTTKNMRKSTLLEVAPQGKIGNVNMGPGGKGVVLLGQNWEKLPIIQAHG